MMTCNFQCRGRPTYFGKYLGKRPTVFALGAGGVLGNVFFQLSFPSSLIFSLEERPIKTEKLFQRAAGGGRVVNGAG